MPRFDLDALATLTEQAFLEAEQLLGMWITVHDVGHAFGVGAGQAFRSCLPADRKRHVHPCCLKVHDDRCLDHCQVGVNSRVQRERRQITHHCWKDIVEVAVPLFDEGLHIATVFGGAYRPVQIKRSVDPRWAAEHATLPAVDEARLHAAGRVLENIAYGVLHRLRAATSQTPPSDRAAQIQRYVRKHFAEDIALEGLADELCLSVSRASHLVKECLGLSFRGLVQQERMERARVLLLTTDLSAEQVAHAIGMESAHHFSRAFKQAHGEPPGRYRRLHRTRA